MQTLSRTIFSLAATVGLSSMAVAQGPALHSNGTPVPPPVNGGQTVAGALWEQLPIFSGAELVNQEFPDFPTFNAYMVDDINVASATNMSEMTGWTTNGFGNWVGLLTAGVVHVYPKTGSLPDNATNNPGSSLVGGDGTDVPITVTLDTGVGGANAVTATGINIALPAGDLWVGITAIGDFGIYGQEFHQQSSPLGDDAALRNPGGAFGLGTTWVNAGLSILGVTGWDSAFRVSGNSGPGSNYCSSSANSTGGAAVITASGSNSIGANNLDLDAQPVPDQPGVFFYGDNQIDIPFGNGRLCTAGSIVRLGVVVGAGNVANQNVDTTAFSNGDSKNFQFWFRDPAGGGAFFDTSDAVNIVFTP
jgi:hypothetical protein